MKTILKDKKEIAQALNFGKYPVLTYDLDENKGSKARITKKSLKGDDLTYRCTLYRGKITKDDGIFYLLTHATMLSATHSVDDYLEDAEFANAPIIEPNTEVAILMFSKLLDEVGVRIVKSGQVDPTFASATTFENITV